MLSCTDAEQLQKRMLALWSALEQAAWETGEYLGGPQPWESTNDGVRSAWNALTAPGNLDGLRAWSKGDLNPTAREATDRAIHECQLRSRDSG
jgi:hypothetical protein